MVAKFLDKIVPPGAYADILSRADTSATCRVHSDHVDSLLRHSGQQGVFIKIHKSESFQEMEFLWVFFVWQLRLFKGHHALPYAFKLRISSKPQPVSWGFLICPIWVVGSWSVFRSLQAQLVRWQCSCPRDGKCKRSFTAPPRCVFLRLLRKEIVARSTLLKASTSSSCCLLPSTPWPKTSAVLKLKPQEQPQKCRPDASRSQAGSLRQPKPCRKVHPPSTQTKALQACRPTSPGSARRDLATASFCTDTFCHESSVCPHSVKVFRVQGRHERDHAPFCPRFSPLYVTLGVRPTNTRMSSTVIAPRAALMMQRSPSIWWPPSTWGVSTMPPSGLRFSSFRSSSSLSL